MNKQHSILIIFNEQDVITNMPHLKGSAVYALESIEEEFTSRLCEAGMEIMFQLLHEYGWAIGGQAFIDDGGW